MEQVFIPITKQARTVVAGDLSRCKQCWIACHGYGQLAPFFIKKLLPLVEVGHAVVAPEGLHRFYLNGSSGRVGASWMTSEERLRDIHDNITYLDQVVKNLKSQIKSSTKLNIFGFSQGAATASRWAASGKTNFHHLVLWSGIFPPDLDLSDNSFPLQSGLTWWVHGKDDEWMSHRDFTEQAEKAKSKIKNLQLLEFNGSHEIPPAILKELLKRMR